MQIARILEDKVDYLTNLNKLICYVIKSKIWVSLKAPNQHIEESGETANT